MTIEQLQESIIGQSFKDQYDTTWSFLPNNMLAWGKGQNIGNAVHYDFIKIDAIIYLKHNGAFGTNNDMTVDILEEDPLEITLIDRYDPKKVFVLA